MRNVSIWGKAYELTAPTASQMVTDHHLEWGACERNGPDGFQNRKVTFRGGSPSSNEFIGPDGAR
eukprot:1955702-Karenia_brevis.AAC.1